jgi:YVTN family beta-propeller protein
MDGRSPGLLDKSQPQVMTLTSRSFAPRLRSVLAGSFLVGTLCLTAAAQSPYKVIDHWKIGGTGGWDYLLADPLAHVLYVTHGPKVEVIDTVTGKVKTEITGMKGTHGIALDTEGHYGYISDGGGNDVLVFERRDFKTITTIPAGMNPDGIVFEPVTKTVWAFNGRSKDATVIDAATAKVVATIPLGGKPEFPTVDGKGNVYDNIETANSIVKLDAAKKAVVATWKLTGCDSPSGMAIDVQQKHLFSVCDGNAMAVVDYSTGKQIATAKIGEGPDAAAFSEQYKLAFSSNGGGTLTVVDAAKGFTPIETLPTQKGARTMAYDLSMDRIYLVSAEFGPAPAATAAMPHPRPVPLPDSFAVIVVGRR